MFGMNRKRVQEVTPRAVRLTEKAADLASISVRVEPVAFARTNETDVLIEIVAAGVNPSDVKAAMGMMPYAVFPRTPGRDFAGVVVEGPKHLMGAEVFGSSGDLGIRLDGTHATHLVVEADAAVLKPRSISLDEAAAIGVPFVTAVEGLTRAGMPEPGETLLILGVNGKVGQAAAQIASWKGARVIGVVRRRETYQGHASSTVEVIDSSSTDVAARLRELTDGKGADIVYNTVGEPYYEAGTNSLAKGGRQVFIASLRQTVPFDIFAFYRGRHTYVGVDTLAMSSTASAAALRSLLPGFESSALKPFPIVGQAIYPLSKAIAAYGAVLDSARDRIILKPSLES